jgi:hypothetical protein
MNGGGWDELTEAQRVQGVLLEALELCQPAMINEKHLQASRGESVCVDIGFAMKAAENALRTAKK